jgi:integrase
MQSSKATISNKPVEYAFMYCNSPNTKRQYPRRLKRFFDFIGLRGKDLEEQAQAFLENARQDRLWASQQIMLYLDNQKQRVIAPKNEKERIAPGTLRTLWTPIKTFCDAYIEILPIINWKRISKSLPRPKTYSSDRIPTLEEIRKLVEYPDRRIKAIIYTMVSSGIRIGAWEFLKWKHVSPITNNDKSEVIVAKLIVYAGEPEEYTTFITPEAYNALKAYMDFRALWGEEITGDSWLMRNYFRTADVKRPLNKSGDKRGGATGVPKKPKKFTSSSMNRMLLRALYEQGLRESPKEEEGGTTTTKTTRRYEFKTAHSYRKYFKTRAEQVMNRLNVECLISHSVGLNSNYYRPTEQELLTDYLKAVPLLTINEQNIEGLKEQQELLEKLQKEKNIEIDNTKKRLAALEEKFEQLVQFSERRAISHELERRRLKGEPNNNNLRLTKSEIQNILNWEMYDDYMLEEYAKEQQQEQQHLYEEYLREEQQEEQSRKNKKKA